MISPASTQRLNCQNRGTQRYQLASLGRRVAVLFTKTYGRVLAPGLSALDPRLPEDVAARSSLSAFWRGFEKNLNGFIQANLVAALNLTVFVNIVATKWI
jgi:hypothetical protein